MSKSKTDFEGMTWCFWLSTFLFKLNKTPTAKNFRPPWRRLLYVLPTWALTSVKRNGPWTICVVITEGTISPPPRLRTCIPPILPPSVQIVSTFMQVTGSWRSLSCCGRNQMSALRILKIQQIKDVFSLFTLIHLCMIDRATQFNLLCHHFCGNVKKDVSSSVSVPAHVWICGQTTTSSSTADQDIGHLESMMHHKAALVLITRVMGLVRVAHNGQFMAKPSCPVISHTSGWSAGTTTSFLFLIIWFGHPGLTKWLMNN